MAAAHCVNGPHGRPGPRQPVPQPGTEAPNPGHGPPGTGAHGSIHPPHPHHHQPRPYFYMQPPPMPPLMHYQWPMPIPYNPYSGFPGMGYGMVMPPFPPTAYMEPPGYVLPHAQLHPADYRRVLQPPYHQSSAHYQNLTQNPNRRFHLQPNPGYVPKETVSSEVQTEPMVPDVRKGSPAFGNKDPLAGSDSGRGTSSSAHSSPGSSDGKAASYPEEERNSIPPSTSKALLLDKGRNQGVSAPTGRKKSQSRRISIEALARVGADLGHFDMSVCSTDSMVPVCSSSNRDDDVIEGRRVSFPDILMGGVGSPAVTKTPDVPRCEHKEPREEEEKKDCDLTPEPCDSPEDCDLTPEPCDSPEDCDLTPEHCDSPEDCDLTTEDCDSPEDCDLTPGNCNFVMDEMVISDSKILKLPFKLHEYILGPRKVDESVWSVESLAPYVPTTEWLIQNGLLDPENFLRQAPYIPSTEWLIQNDLPDPENIPQRVPETSDQDDTLPQQKSFEYVHIKKTADESVWSVDSLAPYVPSADWLIQNDSQNYENVVKEKESDATDGSPTQLLKRMMVAKESRQKLLFSESSMDSLPPYVPSASWLADQGNVYYCSKLLLSSQQDVNVFLSTSDKHGMYRRPNIESELGHSKQQQQEEDNPKKSLNFEFLEKVGLESSLDLPSTIPNVERDPKNATLEGSIEHEHEVLCSPNPRTLDATRNPCSPEHPKPTISIHIEKVESGHGKHEVELHQEMSRNDPKEHSQQMLEKMVMDALTSMSIPTFMGHSTACGLQCFKLLERNCPCEDRPKQHAAAYRKSPLRTGSDEDRPNQHAAAYRKSPLRTGSDEDRPNEHAAAYWKSPLRTGSDEYRAEQHAAAYRKSPLRTGCDEDRPKQHAAAYRKSPLRTGSDEDRAEQHAAAYRKSPLRTGRDEDRTKQHAAAYRKSPLRTGSDEDRPNQHAAAYRKSPLRTGRDEERTKQHAAAYRKSPLRTGRDEERTKQHAAAYRKSPLRTGSDEDRAEQHAAAYRKSPLRTGSDEDRPNQHAAAYRKSPLRTGSEEYRAEQHAAAYRKSPLRTGCDEDRTKQHAAAYRKSPLHTGRDDDRPNQHATAYRKSPLRTGSDEYRAEQHAAAYRKSPLRTGCDEDRTKQHAAAYRKSPLHTGCDEDRTKQHAAAYRKSPLHTGSDEDRTKQHAAAYRKSPLHTGRDEDRPNQHAAAYRKSPLRTGRDEDRPNQHAAAYRKSPLHTGRDEDTGNMPPDASKRLGKRRGNGLQWKTESKRANKARADRGSSDTGHGQRNSKKYIQWKNRTQQDRSQSQTNPTNKPLNQRTGQRNGKERPIMADLENQEEEMEGTH